MMDTPQSLLARLARDPQDKSAWEHLVDLYAPFLRHWCRRLANLSESDADDLVQDVLTVLVQKVPSFVHNQRLGAFRRYLRVTLCNCLHQHLRAVPQVASDMQLAELQDPASELSRRFEEEENEQVTRRLLDLARRQFPTATWIVFQQHVLQSQPADEVARQNNVTRNVVYLARSRVLKWLRQEAEGLLDAPP